MKKMILLVVCLVLILTASVSGATYASKLDRVSAANMKAAILRSGITTADLGDREGSVFTGDVYYVDSGVGQDTGGRGGTSWADSFATVDYALSRCEDDNDDVIYSRANHAESGTDPGLVTVDIDGVTIIGCGNGAAAPTFTFADTDTTFIVSADNVVLYNLGFLAGISDVAVGVSVTGDNCKIIYCHWPEPLDSSFEFTVGLKLGSGADHFRAEGNIVFSCDAEGAESWLDMTAGVNNDTSQRYTYVRRT